MVSVKATGQYPQISVTTIKIVNAIYGARFIELINLAPSKVSL